MHASPITPTTLLSPDRVRSRVSKTLERVGRATNFVIIMAAIVQFYTAGLAVFGAASFIPHARVGWLTQLMSLLTLAFLLSARVPGRLARIALLVLVLAILQPVLAFAFRATLPGIAALHPVNGVAIVALTILLERSLRLRG